MSGNWFDIEAPSIHFRRMLSRWLKKLRGQKLSIEDISVVQVRDRHGTSYEARRCIDDGWTVYRVYSTAYAKKKRISYEKVHDVGTLVQALEILNAICPVTHGKNAGYYNHPLQVALLLPPAPD